MWSLCPQFASIPVVGTRSTGFGGNRKRVFCLNALEAALNDRTLICFNGVTGKITGLQREDGSGRCWNVRVQPGFICFGFFIPRGQETWSFHYAPGSSYATNADRSPLAR